MTEFAKTLVVISHLEKAESLIIWGARTARVEGTELAVLCFTVGKEPQAVEAVSMEDNHEGEDILQAVKKGPQTVASEGLISSQITVHRLIHPNLVKAISTYVKESGADLLVAGTRDDLRITGQVSYATF